MDFSLPAVLLIATGALMIYGSINDLNPITVVKDALTTPSKEPTPLLVNDITPMVPIGSGVAPVTGFVPVTQRNPAV